MHIRNTIIISAFALVAGIGCDADRESAPVADDSINPEIELAQPQPEVPLCSRCNVGKSGGTIAFDDVLEIDIDNNFNGNVISATVTTWDSAGNPSYHYFYSTSALIYDINDPYTETSVAYIEASTAVSAQILWVHTGGTQVDPVTVE